MAHLLFGYTEDNSFVTIPIGKCCEMEHRLFCNKDIVPDTSLQKQSVSLSKKSMYNERLKNNLRFIRD